MDDWESCRPRIAPAALDYLERWQRAFELFGNGQRFLQVANLKKPENKKKSANEPNGDDDGTPTSKLDLALATGNNTTLFDNAGGSGRAFTPGDLALMLLTYQCFSPGGRIGVALWNDTPTAGGGSSDHAPCVAGGMLHALVRGDSLLDSVHRNLMSKNQAEKFFGKNFWGRPVWEMMPERPDDAPAERNASRSYLGRLVPLTRAIWLADDGQSLLLANGLEYASYPSWREPSATVVVRSNEKGQVERRLLRASIEKAAWRELHALTVKAISQDSNGGPAALVNAPDEGAFDLWVGGLVAEQGQAGGHHRVGLPSCPRRDAGRTEPEGIRKGRAARGSDVLSRQAGRLGLSPGSWETSWTDPELKNRRQQIQNKAGAQFWTDVEVSVPRLLEVAADLSSLGLNEEWHKTAWGQAVWRAARKAYERACPHETPRQIRAYALGLRELAAAPGGRPEDEAEKEAEV